SAYHRHDYYEINYVMEGTLYEYIGDVFHVLPPRTVEKIRGADILAINCLREREHPTHLTLERALAYIRDIAPGHAYLTHMCHDLSHVQYQERLPPAVEPAADGLEIAL
ncbi:MAG: MBL fold metallo-hydrolase, partial [Kiritimatiellae bacterium]|nr:MBL fold metallo-hydrolase [Kiritimatiellia bacterium]